MENLDKSDTFKEIISSSFHIITRKIKSEKLLKAAYGGSFFKKPLFFPKTWRKNVPWIFLFNPTYLFPNKPFNSFRTKNQYKNVKLRSTEKFLYRSTRMVCSLSFVYKVQPFLLHFPQTLRSLIYICSMTTIADMFMKIASSFVNMPIAVAHGGSNFLSFLT